MRKSILLLSLLACDIPTQGEIDDAITEATTDATNICKEFIQGQIPTLVLQLATVALDKCKDIDSNLQRLDDSVENYRAAIVYEVLVNMGCDWDGVTYDCKRSHYLCGIE